MTNPVALYAAGLLETSLGLPSGDVDPERIPSDFVDLLKSAVRGGAGPWPSPVLEEAVKRLGAEIESSLVEQNGYSVRKARWPNAADYAVCLTHDVDSISRPIRHILERRDRFSYPDLLLALLHLRSLYDNTEYIARLERARGVRSSFYFLTREYDISRLKRRLARLASEGWDIGLHGDFGTHDSPDRLLEAMKLFQDATSIVPTGVREHYLRFDFQRTWEILEAAGLDYDTTVGTTDTLGFRVGLCTPFHPPDSGWRPLRLLELPLVLMDTTLWGYLKRSEADGFREALALRDAVKQVNGLFTLLWHQESVRMKGGRLYTTILDSLLRDGCFISTGRGISRWWRARETPLLRSGNIVSLSGAPHGLCLLFNSKEGLRLDVEGGEVVERGGTALISAKSEELRLKVS